MKTFNGIPDRSCENCVYENGCRMACFIDLCVEHAFEDKEYERGILGDKKYQALKEEDNY